MNNNLDIHVKDALKARKAGSGADTIVQGWDDAKFGATVISEKSEPNKVELVFPIISDGDSNGTSNGTSKQDSTVNSIVNSTVNFLEDIIDGCEVADVQ